MTAHDPKGHTVPSNVADEPLPSADAFTDVSHSNGKVPAVGEVDADDMFVQGGE